MEIRAKLINISRDWESGKFNLTFSVTEGRIEDIEKFKLMDLLLSLTQFFEKRSNRANRMMWGCIRDLAKAMNLSDWDVYLKMLKRYGISTPAVIPCKELENIKKQWREILVVGDDEIWNESKETYEPAYNVLCFYGSSVYNTQEFSKLLNGIVSEMEDIGLPRPTSEDMKRSIEEWERKHPSSKKT